MTDIATDVALRLAFKKSTSGWGSAPGATGAQVLRRVTSNFNLTKNTLQSQEKRTDYQRADYRHGLGMVGGKIAGELSAGTYQEFFEALCRQDFQSAATSGALSDVTAQASGPQFATAAGNFLTAGLKVGDIGRWTGFAGGSATDNNSRNFLITALTATDMTGIFLDGSAVVADSAGDSVTFTVVGKKTWVPETGHVDAHFDIEHWHSDASLSELYLGCKLNSLGIGLDASRLVSIDMDFVGKTRTNAASAYYTSPTDETDTGLLSPASGFIYVGGSQIALLTGLSFTGAGNMAVADRVVGATRPPAIMEGNVIVRGQFSAYLQDGTLRDYFEDETEVSIFGVFAESDAATADFVSFVMSRCKVGGAEKDSGERGYIQTLPFEALLNVNGGAALANLATTLSIQDSQAT